MAKSKAVGKVKKKSDKEKKEFTIDALKDIEKIFQGLSGILKKIWRLFTTPSLLLGTFKIKNLDSTTDKILKNDKLMKLLAFAGAVLLIINTRYSPPEPQQNAVEIPNYPLLVRDQNENYVIVNNVIPDSVRVVLSGDRNLVEIARTRANFEIYLDLTDLSIGTHSVPIRHTGLSERVNVITDPNIISVTIAELVEREFTVSADLMNEHLFAEWYVLTPTLSLDTVQIRGAGEIVDEVAAVRALIDVSDPNQLVGYEAPVIAVDKLGTPLEVEIVPPILMASVEVLRNSVVVPFAVSTTGSPPEGYSISEIVVYPAEAELFGERAILDSFESFPFSIDLHQLNEDNEISVILEAPDGIQDMDVNEVHVTVQFEPTTRKDFDNVSIHVRNLRMGLIVEFDTADTAIDIRLRGAERILEQITEDHLDVFIDLADFEVGEHEVDIIITLPEFVTGTPSKRRVRIRITETE